MDYGLLAFFWLIYFIVHSMMASNRVKSFFERILESGFRFYRIVYSMIASIGFIALLVFNASIPPVILFESKGLIRYLSLMLATVGVIVISRAFREYRLIAFLGLKQESNEFMRTGILQHVRHPIYSGTILVVIGFFLFNPTLATLLSVGSILVYLPVGIYLEEKKLIRQFGAKYLSYKKDVPSVFPRLKK
jgi:protein-S-isoprenylcysteine O-methyltransferase Ste14